MRTTLPLALALLGLVVGPARADTPRPNVLVVIADDWGTHAGAYGTKWVRTPAFDRIAREGLLFQRAYTPVAKCAPSRASLLTGRYPWQLEEAGNHLAYFPKKFKVWPEALVEKGWFVGSTGKVWAPGVATDAAGKPRQMGGKPFNQHTLKPPTPGISTNDYAKNFTAFLDTAPADKPWCFWCGFLEPHRGYEFQSGVNKGGKKLADIDRVPAYWPDTDVVRHDMLDYAFEVEHADQHLGLILAELERRGQLDNTLVVVTSDHGMPFPRVKGYAYHDANHVPLAVRWPKGIAAGGRTIDDFVAFPDVAATVLDLGGVPQKDSGMASITGTSWRPIFESRKGGQVVPERNHTLVGKERTDVGRPNDWGYPIRGIVRDGFLFLKNYEPTRWPAGNPETGYLDTDGSPTKTLILELGRKNRSDRFWQLGFGMRLGEELYDLATDPDCVKNLATDPMHEPRRALMHSLMTAELKAQGDPRMFGNGAIFDGYPATAGRGFYEKFQRGDKVEFGWANKSDFEKEPIK
ncbi:sulfatase family protein [Limnoglobus roseus]|uniref:Heparan N-sulfatase n=1 Tax=Limnoglobus roseus TaxID=2598579 RepID=A0A5C1A6F7_9BACT|nr:sulfatase [Limnoglobus roseus]QEL13422.1 heparan N-sulfatase [Limnoglobus roseus]